MNDRSRSAPTPRTTKASAPPKLQQRQLIKFPDAATLDWFDSEIANFESGLVASGGVALTEWLATDPVAALNSNRSVCFPSLTHRLSPYAIGRSHLRQWVGRSPQEAIIFIQNRSAWVGEFPASGGALRQALEMICTQVHGRETKMRTGPVGISADNQGYAICFPQAGFIDSRLNEISSWVSTNNKRSATAQGVVLLAALLNCHPFLDGNGRTSRIAFNQIFQKQSHSDFYIPLHEIFSLSGMGFEMSIRTLEITGRWDDLFNYFIALIKLAYGGVFQTGHI